MHRLHSCRVNIVISYLPWELSSDEYSSSSLSDSSPSLELQSLESSAESDSELSSFVWIALAILLLLRVSTVVLLPALEAAIELYLTQ